MNMHWLRRASLFESPKVKRCKRGHDTAVEGFYYSLRTNRDGSRSSDKRCRRCRVEDVANCINRKLKRAA